MKTTTTYIFTDEDIKLLKCPLPDDPCYLCSNRGGCCGCSDGTSYENTILILMEANILEFAKVIRRYRNAAEQIMYLDEKMKEYSNELESVGLNISDFV